MMKQLQANSYLFGGNAPYVEELYERYLDNPGAVPEKWRAYFDQMQLVPAADGSPDSRDVAHAPIVESFAQRAKANAFAPKIASSDLSVARKQVHVQSIIAAYRFLGNRWANLDPLQRRERPPIPELEPGFYDLTEADMDTVFSASNTYFGQEQMTLREIVKALRDIHAVRKRRREYCVARAAPAPAVCNVEQVIDCVSDRDLAKVSCIRRVTPPATDVRANTVDVSVSLCYDESNRSANAVIVEYDIIAEVIAVGRSPSTVPVTVVGVADPVPPATQVGTRGEGHPDLSLTHRLNALRDGLGFTFARQKARCDYKRNCKDGDSGVYHSSGVMRAVFE
jgi:hypothetical protein